MAAMSDVVYTEVNATATITASGISDLILGREPGLTVNPDLDWEGARFAVRAGEHEGERANTVIARFEIGRREKTREMALDLKRREIGTLSGTRVSLSSQQSRMLGGLVQASVRAGVHGGARVVTR
jgi:hypothetical protein